MKKRISYECLLVNGPVKEKVKYTEVGDHYEAKGIHYISFEVYGKPIRIQYDQTHVHLMNDQSVLHFNKDMRVPNKYTLPYGIVELHTNVVSLEYREGTMKFIYELYDQEHLVTKAYMMVHYSDIDEEGMPS